MGRTRTKLEPWIEKTIANHGTEQETSGHLKAHVIGVGQMSHSQAQGREGPTGLLFLSDGVVQIPAALTESAWEHLQEQEDRECFTSLLNTTVLLQAYSVHFHMDVEQTRCRFFMSVGELATTAAGPVKDKTPCCTSLPSVRVKIYKTWKALLNQDSVSHPGSQCAFDLSELLGEWQNNCLEDLTSDIKKRLGASRSPITPQPSTSSSTPTANMYISTGWDVDRVIYKGGGPFSIPVSHLLIPDEGAQPPPEQLPEGSETLSGLVPSADGGPNLPPAAQHTEPCYAVVDVERHIGAQERPETRHDEHAGSQPSMLLPGVIAHNRSNPWDIFPAPSDVLSTSSSSDVSASSEPILPQPPLDLAVKFLSECVASTQVSSNPSEQSFLPAFQKPASTSLIPASSSTNLGGERKSLPQVLSLSSVSAGGTSQTQPPPVPESQQDRAPTGEETDAPDEDIQRKCRKAKRKRSWHFPDAAVDAEEEGQMVSSPPSWLFETQALSGAEAGTSLAWDRPAGTVVRKIPAVHSDGSRFSYTYKVYGQSLQDLSKFEVADDVIHWAVKYLVTPKQANNANQLVC